MSEAYFKFGNFKMGIQDVTAQRILAAGVVVCAVAFVVRRGGVEAVIEAAQKTYAIAADATMQIIDSR